MQTPLKRNPHFQGLFKEYLSSLIKRARVNFGVKGQSTHIFQSDSILSISPLNLFTQLV